MQAQTQAVSTTTVLVTGIGLAATLVVVAGTSVAGAIPQSVLYQAVLDGGG